MKILLKIPLSQYSGYGRDGIGMAQAMVRAGHDVYIYPSEIQAPIPEDVALLLTKKLVAPFDLTIVHLDPARLELNDVERLTTKRVVAWSMWEWESFGNLKGRSKLRKQLKDYDAIIGYDQVTADCFREYYSGPIFVLQGGYEADEIQYHERDWEQDRFYFCMTGVLSTRKNPLVAIQAFSELCNEDPEFDKNARMVLKTVSPPEYFVRMEEVFPNLRVIYETWDRETLIDFYNHMHVLLAPSWGEGKNLPALEFMTSGGSVIATNWGGMNYWMNEDYAYPLNYELASPDPYTTKVRGAKADKEHLKELMKHCFYNREEVKQKGILASQIIPKNHSWDRVVERLEHEIVANIEPREVENGSQRD